MMLAFMMMIGGMAFMRVRTMAKVYERQNKARGRASRVPVSHPTSQARISIRT